MFQLLLFSLYGRLLSFAFTYRVYIKCWSIFYQRVLCIIKKVHLHVFFFAKKTHFVSFNFFNVESLEHSRRREILNSRYSKTNKYSLSSCFIKNTSALSVLPISKDSVFLRIKHEMTTRSKMIAFWTCVYMENVFFLNSPRSLGKSTLNQQLWTISRRHLPMETKSALRLLFAQIVRKIE